MVMNNKGRGNKQKVDAPKRDNDTVTIINGIVAATTCRKLVVHGNGGRRVRYGGHRGHLASSVELAG